MQVQSEPSNRLPPTYLSTDLLAISSVPRAVQSTPSVRLAQGKDTIKSLTWPARGERWLVDHGHNFIPGTKRSAPESEPRETRSSKNPKTSESPKSSAKNGKGAAKGGKKGARASLAPSAFKSKALPLHVNFTHTPPTIADDDKTVPSTAADPGAIGSVTLIPTEFSTGSYGWKGSKRVTIELPNPDGGEPEKVHVMISINATVVGSKNVREEAGDDDDKDAKEAKEDADKVAEESAE
ncbi:hypothetical protein ACEPAF_5220 [Sanghuangporus sanghuang]